MYKQQSQIYKPFTYTYNAPIFPAEKITADWVQAWTDNTTAKNPIILDKYIKPWKSTPWVPQNNPWDKYKKKFEDEWTNDWIYTTATTAVDIRSDIEKNNNIKFLNLGDLKVGYSYTMYGKYGIYHSRALLININSINTVYTFKTELQGAINQDASDYMNSWAAREIIS